jgi:hypothetical protein
VLAGHDNVTIIRTDRLLLPGPCKDLVAAAATQELTCLLDNDVMVTAGWITALIDAIEECAADAVTPLILENSIDNVHADLNFGDFNFRETAEGISLEFVPVAATAEELSGLEGPTPVQVAETHCLLFRTEVLKRLRPFQEPLNTREFIDTSLVLHKAGARLVLQPHSKVIFLPPPPVESDEMPFYLEKWDLDQAAWSHQRIKDKWGLARIPESFNFVTRRVRNRSRLSWLKYTLTTRIPGRVARIARGITGPLARRQDDETA